MSMGFLKALYKRLNGEFALVDPMTAWFGSEASVASNVRAFIVGEHTGIDNLKEFVGPEFKVYAIRENDYLDGDPATLEKEEITVNFFGYFVTDEDLDWAFNEKDYIDFYDWTWDWGGEEFCE